MKKILSILFLCSLIFGSCSKNISDKENGKIRFMFESGELKFISSSFNTDRQTMSALYGNKEALSLLEGARHSHDRVSLKLVTYKMLEDPQYFGSKVNGELLRVETVKAGGDGKLDYTTEYGEIPSGESRGQRIADIMDTDPVNFPL